MGLKKITVMFLGIGAIFAFTGGLGVCAYNCRWYDKNNLWGKSYGGTWKRPLDCALSSGIFGIFRAVLALIALILLLVDVNKIVVAVLFIIDLVLYLGELIPEALLIDDFKYMTMVYPECDTNSDFYKWLDGGQQQAQNQKNQGLTPEDRQKVQRWSEISLFLAGYKSGMCRAWRTDGTWQEGAWTEQGPVDSCVIDFAASTIPASAPTSNFVSKDQCDNYNIVVSECRGGWSADDLTSQARKVCKDYWSQREKMTPSGTNEEEYKKSSLDADKWYGKTLMNAAISDTYISGAQYDAFPTAFVSSVSLANQILLGCQTIAFVATLVGVILLLVRKAAKVSSKP